MTRAILLLAAVMLSGVLSPSHSRAGWFTDDFSTTNQMIITSNENNKKYFAQGVAACNGNAACQVAITAAYFSGAGQQALFRPETLTDILRAFLPYADLGVGLFRTYRSGTNGDSSGFVVTGSNNSFSGIGNKLSSDRNSSATATFSSSTSTATNINNRDYDIGTGSDDESALFDPSSEEIK